MPSFCSFFSLQCKRFLCFSMWEVLDIVCKKGEIATLVDVDFTAYRQAEAKSLNEKKPTFKGTQRNIACN